MVSGHSRKYILYAIGEILLVMIGILLALQVNNWNENRKNNALKHIYIDNLISELEGNMKTWSNLYDHHQNERLRRFDEFFEVLNDPMASQGDLIRVTDSIEFYIGIAGTVSHVIDELQASGNLTIFDREIREEIVRYSSREKFWLKYLEQNLAEAMRLRGHWYDSIDLAYYMGIKNEESPVVKGWKSNKASEAFLKSTNFYAFRYEMTKESMQFYLNAIERTEQFIAVLESARSN